MEKTETGATRDISYGRYQELGGIINEEDYHKALIQADLTTKLMQLLVCQAEKTARVAGFSLDNTKDRLDKITVLYGVLRTDENPEAEFHHGQMCDQRLLAEALRMLDRSDLLIKVIKAYPNINFV